MLLPVPAALATVNNLSITKVNTTNKLPIKIGTMIPPSYILVKVPFGPLCEGQNPPFGSGLEKLDALPNTKRQIT